MFVMCYVYSDNADVLQNHIRVDKSAAEPRLTSTVSVNLADRSDGYRVQASKLAHTVR